MKHIVIIGGGTAGLISALVLRQRLPNISITLLRSSRLGIVGVGEGSTEHFAWFLQYCGLSKYDFIVNAGATVKLGILFRNWLKEGHEYLHSVDHSSNTNNSLGRMDVPMNLYLKPRGRRFPLNTTFEDTAYLNRLPLVPPEYIPANQLHFDTYLLNRTLTEIADRRSITIVDTDLEHIIRHPESGHVLAVNSTTETFQGDFFIDASGFHRFMANHMGNKFISYRKYLPMNRVLVTPSELGKDYEPYTISEAHGAGWRWRIPTQTRYGNGFVFAQEFLTDEAALDQFNSCLGTNHKDLRVISFEAGRLERFWDHNVVNIGLSSSFAEPLEAQSIGLGIQQARYLINLIDLWPYSAVDLKYNASMNRMWDNVVDYLQLHYLTSRTDTEFWQARPWQQTDFLEHNLPLWRRGRFEIDQFHTDSLFHIANFFQVCAGLDIIDKEQAINYYDQTFTEDYHNEIDRQAEVCRSEHTRLSLSMSHRQLIELIIENHYFRLKNSPGP